MRLPGELSATEGPEAKGATVSMLSRIDSGDSAGDGGPRLALPLVLRLLGIEVTWGGSFIAGLVICARREA